MYRYVLLNTYIYIILIIIGLYMYSNVHIIIYIHILANKHIYNRIRIDVIQTM